MRAHNLKVVGSNPAPATNLKPQKLECFLGFLYQSFTTIPFKNEKSPKLSHQIGQVRGEQLVAGS